MPVAELRPQSAICRVAPVCDASARKTIWCALKCVFAWTVKTMKRLQVLKRVMKTNSFYDLVQLDICRLQLIYSIAVTYLSLTTRACVVPL